MSGDANLNSDPPPLPSRIDLVQSPLPPLPPVSPLNHNNSTTTTKQLENGNSKSSIKITKRNGDQRKGKPNATTASSNTTTTTAASNGGNKGASSSVIAHEFKSKLDTVMENKGSISKEKMNQLVQEAINSVKYYKHVVYYIESFIKNVRLYLFIYFCFLVILNKL